MAERDEEAEFRRTVREKAERKRGARGRRDDVWFWLGMFGMVGWSVVVPMVIGVGVGIWLDSTTSTRISWTLTGLAVGLAVGCAIAWYWIRQEGGRG